ncbi:MAG: AAA family ATPase [Gammaproteobacteria bacterium]|nr:AAA family ATPase [Gammaproteobacteria bacterium]
MNRYPIGISDFKEIIDNGYCFVDKTLLIQELLQDPAKILLFTRPRRFGKTLNLSMLEYFFTQQQADENRTLFNGTLIEKARLSNGMACMDFQGKYPVIFLSLKDVKASHYQDAYEAIAIQISQLYKKHRYLLEQPELLYPDEKDVYQKIIEGKANPPQLQTSLRNLTEYLGKQYGEKVLILIDEYDTPLHASYEYGYYDEMVNLIRTLLSAVLKDNVYLYKGILTGILRVAKESIFSDLNNVDVYSILQAKYGQYFGFTESEVQQCLKEADLEDQSQAIRDWYNGYLFGDEVIYNPWSILNCLNKKGLLQPYWVNTGGLTIIRNLLARSGEEIKGSFEALIQGQTITCDVSEHITFGDIMKNAEFIWSFLLLSGYLKIAQRELVRGRYRCQLAIPNHEIGYLYENIFLNWLGGINLDIYRTFLDNLTTGNITDFESQLQKILSESYSYFDLSGQEPEKFYHAIVLSLLVGLRDTYQVKSNRESGYGRYDVMLIPYDKTKLGLIIEFKTAKSAAELESAADVAMQQIADKNYVAELTEAGIKNILQLGMAFYGKKVLIKQKNSQP